MRKVRIRVSDLFWDEWNSQHIKKHNVTKLEIAEAFSNALQARRGHSNRLIVFGKTDKGRILAIVIKKTNKGYYVFSARDANRKEKKYL